MATVAVKENDLVVTVNGLDKLWAFKSEITIPLVHVRGVTADPGMVQEPKGRRSPGLHVPGVKIAGSFVQDGERIFWDVRDASRAVVIELRDETYRRLVVEVEDPRRTVAQVEQALSPH